MQKYGDFPVSHFTGVPDIKVPIYTIQEGDINVPIYLSFHASGLNLDDNRGLIGPGWTLHTGGLVSRAINGLPDEYSEYGYGFHVPADFTYNYDTRYLEMKDTYHNTLNDHEFDIHSYNVLGRSGKYIPSAYDPNLNGLFVLQKDNFNVNTGTDENGLMYVFGGTGYEEYTTYYHSRLEWDFNTVSTWHLKNIRSSRHPGRTVDYQYQDGPQYMVGELSWQYTLDDFYYFDSWIGSPDGWDVSEILPHSRPKANSYIGTSFGRTFSTRVPQKITFSGGYLLFFLNSAKYLDRIEIYNNKNELLRKVELQATEPTPIPHYFSSRILNHIVFKDANNIEQERYSFTYYNAQTNFSLSKDHWGFYNGRTRDGNGNLIGIPNFFTSYLDVNLSHPYQMIYTAGGTADRQADASQAVSMMLQRITYPTKGYTEFIYEGHEDAAGRPAGGVRIKNIVSYTAQNEVASQKNYVYGPGACEYYPTAELYVQHSEVIVGEVPGRRTAISAFSPINLSPKGSSVAYSSVTEYDGDKTTIFQYDTGDAYTYERLDNPSHSSIPGESNPQFKLFQNNYKPWTYGTLIAKHTLSPGYERREFYNYQDSLLHTIRDLVMNQRIFPYWTPNFHGLTANQRFLEEDIHSRYGLYAFANRYHHSGLKRQIGTSITEKWSNGRELTTTEEYEYGSTAYPLQKTAMTTTDSKGRLIRTTYKYPYDYPSDPAYQELTLQNRISTPVEETSTNQTLSKEIKKINRDYALINTPIQAQLSAIRASVGGSTPETEVTADRYDSRGHILEQTEKGGLKTSYIYGYGQLYPVAKIVGADYNTAISLVNQAFLDDGSNTESAIRSHLSSLRGGLPSAQISTYTYKIGLGMSSETDPRGQTSYYEYDNFQRLARIKDHNGNILKEYCYNYAGQQTTCYSIGIPLVINTGGGGTQTIYARAEYQDRTGDYGYIGEFYHSYWWADLYFRFYSDAACTQPYTLTSNLDVHYTNEMGYYYNGGSSPSTFSSSIQVPSGTNSFYFGNVETSYYEEYAWDDDWGYLYDQYTYYVYITSNTGYQSESTINHY